MSRPRIRRRSLPLRLALAFSAVALSAVALSAAGAAWAEEPAAKDSAPGTKIHFKKQQLDPKFRSEGVAVGDFNKDGKNDIAAGFVWYEAPDWKMHNLTEKAPEYEPKGYSNSFCN